VRPSNTTIKTLFGLSGNLCAYPECTEEMTNPAWRTVCGEIAHIRGEKPGSARYDPSMTDEERCDYWNLILLCPLHHKLIDGLDPDGHSVERLQDMKAHHEERMGERTNWADEDDLTKFAVLVVEDQFLREPAPAQTLHDSAGATDSIATPRLRTMTDSASATDSLARPVARTLTDTAGAEA